ncbi:hypothetical protein EXH44_10970 [Actinobacillus indolicus]|uniref:Uncharacterized protein n=1 Tax=Actinobacillus indolicus TaxID=51049 RepID=A0A4P7CGN4_9PAST|nr:hypothetical protein [Actinobacillus indolicus]QBQ62742.1 hypothetical protein EXH44_00095 [Actinobacillus indolicus]QBQ64704.1 hypothetical protein EXH44_10970 [Actinobacillus indolicus]
MGIRDIFESFGWLFRTFFSLVVVVFVLPVIIIAWIIFATSLNTPDFPWATIVGSAPFFLLLGAYYLEQYKINRHLKRNKKQH